MIPHTAPPFWPETRLGRLAAAICRNSVELRDDPRSDDLLAKCRVALIGIPDDTGVALNHGRVGAREGPHAFRAALARYGAAIPMGHPAAAQPPHAPLTLAYPHIFDAGDVIPGRDLHETHDRVTEAVAALLDRGLFPVAIGGGHDLTFPFVRAVAAATGPLHGLYLDAHLDVRAEIGSGMPFRRLIETGAVSRLAVVGINPLVNSDEHARWFVEHHGRFEDPSPASPALAAGAPMFVSIDLDSIDQAFAPGVSATNPAGLTPQTAASYALAAGLAPHVRCFDIMELNPAHDEHGRTARLAAHLFLMFLRGFALRGGRNGS